MFRHEVVEDGEHVVEDGDELRRRHPRRHPGEVDDVGEHQRDVLEPVRDDRLAVPQAVGDRLREDVQQQALVLGGEPRPLTFGRHVRAVDVEEPELGHVDRDELVHPAARFHLDRTVATRAQGRVQLRREAVAELQAEAGDEPARRRVGVDEGARPIRPEHRVRIVVRELDDGPLCRHVHAVDVGEPELADHDGPQRVGSRLRGHLDEAALRGCSGDPCKVVRPEAPAPSRAERLEQAAARRVRVDQAAIGIDPHDRVRVVVGKSVDRGDLCARERRLRPASGRGSSSGAAICHPLMLGGAVNRRRPGCRPETTARVSARAPSARVSVCASARWCGPSFNRRPTRGRAGRCRTRAGRCRP